MLFIYLERRSSLREVNEVNVNRILEVNQKDYMEKVLLVIDFEEVKVVGDEN